MVNIIILIISSLFLIYAFFHAKEICSSIPATLIFISEISVYFILLFVTINELFA